MITNQVDLRSHFGPARDQGPRPTCLAFSASDAHAAARPGWQPLSAEWVYYNAVRLAGGHPDQGTTLAAMLSTIKSDGQPIESTWPYINAPIANASSWAPPSPVTQLFRRDHAGCTASVTDVLNELIADQPVLIVMTISDAFYLPDSNGTIRRIEPIDSTRRHAVVAVGYGKEPVSAETYILIRNSWGPAWGLNGHAWLHSDYLTPRLVAAAIMTTEL